MTKKRIFKVRITNIDMDFFISCSAFSIKIHCSKQGKCTEQIALDTCFYLASEQLNYTAFDLPAECCEIDPRLHSSSFIKPQHTQSISYNLKFSASRKSHIQSAYHFECYIIFSKNMRIIKSAM